MQASSNREENRTVLSFWAHLSLSLSLSRFFFFRVDRACRVGYSPFARTPRRDFARYDRPAQNQRRCHLKLGFVLNAFSARSREKRQNDYAESPELSRERDSSLSGNRRSLFVRTNSRKRKLRRASCDLRSFDREEIGWVNVIVNGQHDNTTRTTIM